MRVLYVCRWQEDYEVSQSRKYRHLSWRPKPLYQPFEPQSVKRNRVLASPDGLRIWGLFDLICDLAAQSPRRGYLVISTGEALGAADVARIFHQDPEFVGRAFSILLTEEVGLMEWRELAVGDEAVAIREDLPLWKDAPTIPDPQAPDTSLPACSQRAPSVLPDIEDKTKNTGPVPVIIPIAQHTGTGPVTGAQAKPERLRNLAGLRAQRPDERELASKVRHYTDVLSERGRVGPTWKNDVAKLCMAIPTLINTDGQEGSLQAMAERIDACESPPRAAAELLWKLAHAAKAKTKDPRARPWAIWQAYADDVVFENESMAGNARARA